MDHESPRVSEGQEKLHSVGITALTGLVQLVDADTLAQALAALDTIAIGLGIGTLRAGIATETIRGAR